ncbi:hypothetical protein [Sporichthya sp.]|uniref:hypothetical protein n=1 Tax=Sporichthya sp. TaxID=65475 RepID=UPI001832CEC9|nr:hypothetical protein [Sporichthya sp.]MBA3745655.1 hypothetical protein [Sporichthya sp.]
MTTSLASSPVLPIVMAGVAGLLVFGTLSSNANSSSSAEEPGGLPAPEVPVVPTGDTVPAKCKGNVCTITFPKAGDSAQAFGTTVQAVKFYVDGMSVSIGGQSVVSSLKVANKAGGYTLKIVKVDPAGQTVKITKK